MVRALLLVGLAATLVIVLYVPARSSPEQLFDRLREEYASTVDFWSEANARRVLARGGTFFDLVGPVAPVVERATAPTESAAAMAAATERLLGSAYFRGVDAVLIVAAFRLAALTEWLAWLSPLLAAAWFDASRVRLIRSKQVSAHDPEGFSLRAGCAAAVLSALSIVLVAPVTVPPWIFPAASTALFLVVGSARERYHRHP